MKYLLSIIILSFFSYNANCQVIRYDRAGVTVLLTSNSPKNLVSKVSDLKLGNGYDINKIPITKIDGTSIPVLEQNIKKLKIPAASLGSLRDLDSLINRVKYNLKSNDLSLLKESTRGVSKINDQKWIDRIIMNNYLVIINVNKVVPVDEYYEIQEMASSLSSIVSGGSSSSSVRVTEGYFANVTVNLFHIQLDDISKSYFWKYWNDDELHNSHDYPIAHVLTERVWLDGTQSAENGEYSDLHQLLLDKGIQRLLNYLGEFFFPLSIKAPVSNIKPVQAKIGKKEGIEPNQLFFVYELLERSSGEIELSKKGVVRAKNVVDNRSNNFDKSKASSFYKVHHGNLKTGMYLVPIHDKGIAVTLGFSEAPFREFKGTIGLDLAKRLSLRSLFNWRLYLAFGYAPLLEDINPFFENYAEQNGDQFYKANRMSSFNYGVGLEKDLYLLSWVQLTPFIALHQEFMSYIDRSTINRMIGNSDLLNGYGTFWNLQVGFRLPLNITYNLKLVPSVGYTTRNINTTTSAGGAAGFMPSRIRTDQNYLLDLQIRFEF